MNMLQNAHILMCGLHCLNEVINLGIDRHNKGEHVTFGDVANIIAKELPAAIATAGIQDTPFRVHPHLPPQPKRPGPNHPRMKLPGSI